MQAGVWLQPFSSHLKPDNGKIRKLKQGPAWYVQGYGDVLLIGLTTLLPTNW